MIPLGNMTVMVDPLESAPAEDAVQPITHESATPEAVVVGTKVTLERFAEDVVNVTVEVGLAGIVSDDVRTLKESGCTRAILVGHNAAFDLGFLNAAVARTGIKRNPFHPFSCFDTATLGGVAFGQTVLSKAVLAAGLTWDRDSAHSARYDAEQTADLFCDICNQFKPIFDSARRRIANLVEAGEAPEDSPNELEPAPLEPAEG